ncbi:MAG: hypothetical protein JSS27_10215 [Planctomycetes bacterium]|nr:hypothetical protein [Planctomycetota bacterium]
MLALDVPTAFSDEAIAVEKLTREEIERFVDSESLGIGSALRELNRVCQDCQLPNWDGDGALAVEDASCYNAERLLRSLPWDCPLPEVGVETDGQITLDWHRSPRSTVSISITPEANLHYAALFGAYPSYGTEPFFGEVPETILSLIRRVGLNDRFQQR